MHSGFKLFSQLQGLDHPKINDTFSTTKSFFLLTMASLSNSLHIFETMYAVHLSSRDSVWMGEVTSLRSEPLAGSLCPGSAADGLLDDGLAEYEARRCRQIRSRFAGNHHIAHRASYFPYCQLANRPFLESTSRHRKPRENQWPRILKYMSSLKATN